ncbi:MAG: HAMP domain-containing protein, partial [bacterium]
MKKPKSLFWQYFPLYLVILVISLGVLTWVVSLAVRDTYIELSKKDLRNRSLLIAHIIQDDILSERFDTVQNLCKNLGQHIGFRITVILPSGRVVADSDHDPDLMENHADRPEIRTAMNDSTGTSIRYSATIKKHMIYTAVPLSHQGQIKAVVRSSFPIIKLYRTINAFYRRMVVIGIIVIFLAVTISFLLSRRIKSIIRNLKEAAVNFGKGKLNHRVHISGSEEFEILSVAMNKMAEDLNSRINKISEQHKEMESVISCMSEGLLVIDLEEKVV